jgi:hypothetical protein
MKPTNVLKPSLFINSEMFICLYKSLSVAVYYIFIEKLKDMMNNPFALNIVWIFGYTIYQLLSNYPSGKNVNTFK